MSKRFSLKSFLSNTKIDFMGVHKLVIFISIISIIISIALVFTRGLNFGIDFSGGVLIEARLAERADITEIRNLLSEETLGEISIQNFDEKDLMIRVSSSKDRDQNAIIKRIQEILNNNFDNIEYRKVDFVGPQVGKELITNGFLSLFLSFVFIMIYIWVRFDWQFGLGAILALIHDAALMFGFFSLSGLEFNLSSIAAVLTIIGYSINDSVVIYDRVRENLRKYKKMDLAELLNISINSTLSRTALTAGVTLASLFALIIYGGDVLKSFSIAVFFGIIIGTYSSIYISAPILLYMDPRKKDEKK
jgi:preprotein translocase subunit SecF